MPLFESVIRTLNASGTRYLVVGGLATVLHGHARMTADIDVIVDLEPTAALAAMKALTSMGLVPRPPVPAASFADPELRRSWAKDKGMRVFSLWDPGNPMLEVDVFIEHPIPFDELMARSLEIEALGMRIPVVSIEDLIALKRLADRPQDHEDIRALETIARAKTKGAR